MSQEQRSDTGSLPLQDDVRAGVRGSEPSGGLGRALRGAVSGRAPGATAMAAPPGALPGTGSGSAARDARSTPVRPVPRRRAKLALTRVDPWSVFVLSLLISIFLGVVLFVCVFVLYNLIESLGVIASINDFAETLQIIGPGESVVTSGRVYGIAAVVAAVDVVLLTVLATLGGFLYNLCASLTGGVEVTLGERD